MRLEVRADDPATQAFYGREGYRSFGAQAHYYDDDADAVRLEKSLASPLNPELARVIRGTTALDHHRP